MNREAASETAIYWDRLPRQSQVDSRLLTMGLNLPENGLWQGYIKHPGLGQDQTMGIRSPNTTPGIPK